MARTPRPAAVRVVALLAGLVALVVTREVTRALPWWLSGACAVLAFLVVARAVNAVSDSVATARGGRR